MATIVIPLQKKEHFTASWHSFHKSMNHAEELKPTWHTEGGRLLCRDHMTPL